MSPTIHHAIVSGPGRAGTTLVMRVLTELGADTGFDPRACATTNIHGRSHGGLEREPRALHDEAPYIVKSPFLCNELARHLADGDVIVDRAIVCLRDPDAIAKSRAAVSEAGCATGGFWDAKDLESQSRQVETATLRLLLTLAEFEIPLTLLRFPRLARDAGYLSRGLGPLVPDVGPEAFASAFARIVDPRLVHFE